MIKQRAHHDQPQALHGEEKSKDTLNEYVLNTVLAPKTLAEKDVELWIQYSTDSTIPLGSLVVDLWYC
jgi:hypothetical protein